MRPRVRHTPPVQWTPAANPLQMELMERSAPQPAAAAAAKKKADGEAAAAAAKKKAYEAAAAAGVGYDEL